MKTILAVICAMLVFTAISGCKKEKISCTADTEFCALIDQQQYDSTGTSIDNFLKDLNTNDPQKNLDALADWLECMSCVNKVKILCNSCIETLQQSAN